jgi:methyl-accepting chemotaxis protein
MQEISRMAQESILRARMQGERLIAITRLILMVPLSLFILLVFLKKAAEVGVVKAMGDATFSIELLCLVAALIYTLWILRQLKRDRYFNSIKYLSPFIEVTLLNIIMFANATYPGVSLIITGAPTFLYFVFLALCAFRNSSSSVLFMGIYAAISYLALSFRSLSILKIFQDDGKFFTNAFSQIVRLDWDDEIIKPVAFLLTAILLSSLARRFNRTVKDQIETSIERERLKEVFVDNVKQVSENLLSSGKALSKTYKEFSERIGEMVGSSRKIGDETSAEYGIIEATSKTVTDMIRSIEAVTGNIKEQSFLVGETAAAIAEMESSIRTITDTSQKASAVAQNLFSAAKDGGGAVSEVYNAIIETEKSSRQIEEIVGLITGIAATTNLLSMNAAIEAAHAGEAGRGFAVVADEIRRLAETSGSNAKQIGDILKDILTRIQNITALAQQANEKLQSILSDADQTKGINSTIQNAMEEELRTVNEIIKSLSSLENITGQVKDASIRQSEGSTGLVASVNQLKKQADNVSGLTQDQVAQCGNINTLSSSFNSVVQNNDTIIEQLDGLVKKI